MNAAAERLPGIRLEDCSSIDLMSRYIAITAEMRRSPTEHLAATQQRLRELIVKRIGPEVAATFIGEVERAASK